MAAWGYDFYLQVLKVSLTSEIHALSALEDKNNNSYILYVLLHSFNPKSLEVRNTSEKSKKIRVKS